MFLFVVYITIEKKTTTMLVDDNDGHGFSRGEDVQRRANVDNSTLAT